MVIVLNGPLGIGKSTLAEALMERIEGCAMLDGDQLVAVNPPHRDELEHLHTTVALLAAHHQRFGYRHFVIDHIWRTPAELDDLRLRLNPVDSSFHCFLLTLPLAENLRRIELRAGARAVDELDWERATLLAERETLASDQAGGLGEPFEVSAPPDQLAERMMRVLGL